MGLVPRIKGLLLNPREEWQRIAEEPMPSPLAPLTRYASVLVALSTLASFAAGDLDPVLFVDGKPAEPIRLPPLGAALSVFTSFAFGLLSVFVAGRLIKALALRCGGAADDLAAMKLAAYAPTAAWLSTVAALIPFLGFVVVLGFLYSVYVFWVGVPMLVGVPTRRRLAFTLVLLVCWLAVLLLAMAILALALGIIVAVLSPL